MDLGYYLNFRCSLKRVKRFLGAVVIGAVLSWGARVVTVSLFLQAHKHSCLSKLVLTHFLLIS